jgi:sugar phosphate isomerase/epimerase
MKFAICQELFEGWDWDRQCRFISECGYTGIEIAPYTLGSHPRELDAARRRQLRSSAENSGLQVVGLHWLLARTEGLHLTSDDAAVRDATAGYLADLADLCADLGGRVLVFGSPPQRNIREGMPRAAAFDAAVDVFQKCLPRLADRDVTLCMEPLTPKETNFINTCAEAADLIAAVDHPRMALHQDVKAMLSEERTIPDLIHAYRHLTRHVHVNDSNLLGPGMGETDFEPIFKALIDAQYDGWVSVEVFDYSPGCEHIATESINYMRTTLARLAR